ncbi:MAG TPA: acyltransferase [Bacteroidales bacterium]|nr:acyltransferase [Bacteroidales bacterium]
MKIARIKMANFPTIYGSIYIRNRGKILIGKNVTISSGKNYNIIGGDTRTSILVNKNSNLSLGDNVGISNSTILCYNSITIENNVLVGGSCKIYDTDFHSIDPIQRMNPYVNNIPDNNIKSFPVVIKSGAWIGGHCIILKGVTIGENSIIGAGSVVNKNIPANEIWGGAPAKFLKKVQ